MTIDDVKARIAAIAGSDDDEHQHILQDELLLDVLRAIASGEDGAELAREALKVEQIDFCRWCS